MALQKDGGFDFPLVNKETTSSHGKSSKYLIFCCITTVTINGLLLLAAISGLIMAGWIKKSIVSVMPDFAEDGTWLLYTVFGLIFSGSAMAVAGAWLMKRHKSFGFVLYSIPVGIVLGLNIIGLLSVFTWIQLIIIAWIATFIVLYSISLNKMKQKNTNKRDECL